MKASMSLLWILALILVTTSAFALPVNIEEVRVDDYALADNQVNRLDVQRNAKHLVDIKFSPTQDIRNAELEIFVSGFEYKDIHPISDTTGVFDADANVTYVKRLSFTLTDEVEKDDYKLRVILTDRNGQETIKSYNLLFDVPRHALKVEDVIFSPNGAVKAGQALLSTVRIENKGDKDEKDVRVEVSVPDLGITGTDYIDSIRSGKEETTEEIFMKVPTCAKEGLYPVNVKVQYNQLHDFSLAQSKVLVLGNPSCGQTKNDSVQVIQPIQQTPIHVNTSRVDVSDGSDVLVEAWTLRRILEVALIILLTVLATIFVLFAISKARGE